MTSNNARKEQRIVKPGGCKCAQSDGGPPTFHNGKKSSTYGVMGILAVITIIVYHGVLGNDFINYDDDVYVTSNNNLHAGLSWKNIKWAFTSTHANNWHPVTWLSHMVDVSMHDLNPAGHHLTNLILHTIATAVLFLFLYSSTGNLFPSALTATLFSIHPVHVESVAWVAERKDVLSALFCFLALLAYAHYARKPKVYRYALVVVLFAFGIMAKPMLVSLPIILLLVDFWPLQRVKRDVKIYRQLLLEKVPFFLMAAASSAITLIAQQEAIGNFSRISLVLRVSNAVISYGIYLKQAIWPFDLSIFYPYRQYPVYIVVLCLLLIGITSGMVIWAGLKKKFFLTGWLWYLLTLIPVIGLIQVGDQAHADRYTYLPLIGIFVVFSWWLNDFLNLFGSKKNIVAGIVILLAISVLSPITVKQIERWKDSITLFSHAINVIPGNYLAYNNLGVALEQNDRINEAISSYKKALDIEPSYADAHYNLGVAMARINRMDEAIYYYKKTLETRPDDLKAINNLAGAYYNKNDLAMSISLLNRALSLAKESKNDRMAGDIVKNLDYLQQKFDELKNR
ncbi:MAG: tetratricopeptide repeat protein [Chitinispirillaceae bacterium]|nr:tetratricopeptide repeat protein [Chitinispirillaceae bacterium]